jgi:hypothetical protein
MTVCIKTLKLILLCIAITTKIKVVAVLTHPTILCDHLFAVKTFKLFIPEVLLLENGLKLMIRSMTFGKVSFL